MPWGVFAGRVGEGRLKQGLKQGLLMHSEQIIKGGGEHWIIMLV